MPFLPTIPRLLVLPSLQPQNPMSANTPSDFATQVPRELRNINNRLDKMEARLDTYQRGLDGIVRMATTIIVTTGAVVVIGNIVPAILMFTKFAKVATR
ncbi:MAG: hypothetical protein Q6K90_07015 [Gloeomargarita sp. HHBFW_bins_162]